MYLLKSLVVLLSFVSCTNAENVPVAIDSVDSIQHTTGISQLADSLLLDTIPAADKHVTREELVGYAKTLIGTPYKYGCSNPSNGFDCSGFISYVFDQFNIKVPRSSIDFTNIGTEVSIPTAKPGDLILFTGTDNTIRKVGHIGIVIENTDTLKFIHSSSGKVMGVVITPLNEYYQGRFMKVIDILSQ